MLNFQELEKFKFVLDYKIKDLKQQIGPREVELQDTRDIIQKMEKELQRLLQRKKKKNLIKKTIYVKKNHLYQNTNSKITHFLLIQMIEQSISIK